MFAAGLKILGDVSSGHHCVASVKHISISQTDTVYPVLVKAVLPEWALGLFDAVIVGSILSSFNDALNSAGPLLY